MANLSQLALSITETFGLTREVLCKEVKSMARPKSVCRPIPTTLSRLDDRCQIIYVCPKCKQSLEMLGNMAHDCPQCSAALDWTRLPMRVSKEFREEYEAILYAEEKPAKKVSSSGKGKKKAKSETKEDTLLSKLKEYVAATK